ncbi:MAG: hypothetical protein RL208_183 [Pseudomonadota bacterium]|jgi:single-strand DNA-binding protein
MLNKVTLIGNVGQDPEIKTLPSGNHVANFSLATTEYWKDKSGQKQSSTEWHRIVVYNENLVKLIEKAVHKGSKLYLEGTIRSRKYTDSNSVERVSYEILLQAGAELKLLDSKPANSKNGSEDEHNYSQQSSNNNSSNTNNIEIDDDMPF